MNYELLFAFCTGAMMPLILVTLWVLLRRVTRKGTVQYGLDLFTLSERLRSAGGRIIFTGWTTQNWLIGFGRLQIKAGSRKRHPPKRVELTPAELEALRAASGFPPVGKLTAEEQTRVEELHPAVNDGLAAFREADGG